MIYKKEVLDVMMPDVYDTDERYAVVARIVKLPRTGKCLIADFYDEGVLTYRYCLCDGNYIVYDAREQTWGRSRPNWLDYGYTYNYADSDRITDLHVMKYTGEDHGSAATLIQQHCDRIYEERAFIYARNRYERQEARLARFGEVGQEIGSWLDENVFKNHIWMSNAERAEQSPAPTVGKSCRRCVCEACGAVSYVSTGEKLHKAHTVCTECGRESIYFLERYKSSICDKCKVHIVTEDGEGKLFRWARVRRTYMPEKKYGYDDYFYSGAERSGKKWAYGEKHPMYSDVYIGEKKWMTPSWRNDAVLYPGGLNRIYPDTGFDLEAVLGKGYKIDMPVLAAALYKYPQTEYLIKCGLVQFVPYIEYMNPDGTSFEEVFGVSGQYRRMFVSERVSFSEFCQIRQLDGHGETVTPELFGLMRAVKYEYCAAEEYSKLMGVSHARVIRYAYRQELGIQAAYLMHRDYFDMCRELKIELTRKYDIWPKNLRAEHDRLAERLNEIRAQKAEKKQKRDMRRVCASLPKEFGDKRYTVVLPKSDMDFVAEGQALKICVGSGSYARKHWAGKSVICFIRCTEKPEESFVCCEIDNATLEIIQIHGYKNDIGSRLPAGVRAFAEKYCKAIREHRESAEQDKNKKKERKTA